MKIFLAAAYVGFRSNQPPKLLAYPHILESYHYIKAQGMVDAIRRHSAKRKIFLDSGAYSAFTKGAQISIQEYAKFIHRNQDFIEFAANLDDLSAKNKDDGAEATWRNQKQLEQTVPKGVYVLPV